MGEERMSET